MKGLVHMQRSLSKRNSVGTLCADVSELETLQLRGARAEESRWPGRRGPQGVGK